MHPLFWSQCFLLLCARLGCRPEGLFASRDARHMPVGTDLITAVQLPLLDTLRLVTRTHYHRSRLH